MREHLPEIGGGLIADVAGAIILIDEIADGRRPSERH